jgi:hypothetical protein
VIFGATNSALAGSRSTIRCSIELSTTSSSVIRLANALSMAASFASGATVATYASVSSRVVLSQCPPRIAACPE